LLEIARSAARVAFGRSSQNAGRGSGSSEKAAEFTIWTDCNGDNCIVAIQNLANDFVCGKSTSCSLFDPQFRLGSDPPRLAEELLFRGSDPSRLTEELCFLSIMVRSVFLGLELVTLLLSLSIVGCLGNLRLLP
jgi:hypothetical protein